MTATRLNLYQGAVLLLGDRPLVTLTDNREARRAADIVWDGGAVNYALSRGLWNFAIRTVQIDADPDFTPTFGYRKVFTKPSDWIRTNGVSADEYFTQPLNQYKDEGNKIFADQDTIYLSYVSNDDAYGGDLSLWTEAFRRYFESYLSVEICSRITSNDSKKDGLYKLMTQRLMEAKSIDAQNEAAAFPPAGSWTRARAGYRTSPSNERRGS